MTAGSGPDNPPANAPDTSPPNPNEHSPASGPDHLPENGPDDLPENGPAKEPTSRSGSGQRNAPGLGLGLVRGIRRRRLWPAGRQPLRAVIFDLDGVLVDSFHVMRQAFDIAYAEVVGPGPAPFEEYNRHLGRYFPDIMDLMGLPREMEGPFVRESYRLAGEVRMFDGVPEMLSTLRGSGLRLAVATGKAGDRARSLLAGLDILEHFEHVIGGDEVARSKPAPDMVLRALRLLRVKPGQTFMIGDAVTDIISAKNASVAAVAALWAGHDPEPVLAQQPDAVLRSPAEVVTLCRDWNARARRDTSRAG